VTAVAFEIAIFITLIGYRSWRAQTASAKEVSQALQTIEQASRVVSTVRRTIAIAGITVLGAACIYMTIDLAALLIAFSGHPGAASQIYERIAVPAETGVHPALSMELLAGAYIDAGKLKQAEPLMVTLSDVRNDIAGRKSELVAAMYSNLGDFYVKAGKFGEAETLYRLAIALTKELKLPQGYGTPATKLASLLRDEHRLTDSEIAFGDALWIRTSIFGPDSIKVQETLKEYVILKQAEHDAKAVNEMNDRIARIDRLHPIKSGGVADVVAPAAVLCLSLVFFFNRDRIIIATAALVSKGRQAREP
jgi:hypothetical protein